MSSIIKWNRDSDINFYVSFFDESGNIINPFDKSFKILIFTTNQKYGAEASYNKNLNMFTNCGVHKSDPLKLELAFNKPMLKPGRVYFKTSFANENELFLDGHYDIVKSIPTNMYIVK